MSRCWDVANFCPLVVFVAGVRSRCPCSGVWLLAALCVQKLTIIYYKVLCRCGGIFSNYCILKLVLSVSVEKFWNGAIFDALMMTKKLVAHFLDQFVSLYTLWLCFPWVQFGASHHKTTKTCFLPHLPRTIKLIDNCSEHTAVKSCHFVVYNSLMGSLCFAGSDARFY